MKTVRRGILLTVAALAVLVSGFSHEVRAEVGLVTYVSGDVYYGKGKSGKAVSFMKAKDGDVFNMADGSKMRIVYFKNGRKEKWTGAVEVTISADKGIASIEAKAPSITTSESSLDGLRTIPSFIEEINTERTGGTKVRALLSKKYRRYDELSDSEKLEVMAAKEKYNKMLKTSEPDDITPELFSISVLSKYQLFRETLGLVKIALQKQPDNKALALLEASLGRIINYNQPE